MLFPSSLPHSLVSSPSHLSSPPSPNIYLTFSHPRFFISIFITKCDVPDVVLHALRRVRLAPMSDLLLSTRVFRRVLIHPHRRLIFVSGVLIACFLTSLAHALGVIETGTMPSRPKCVRSVGVPCSSSCISHQIPQWRGSSCISHQPFSFSVFCRSLLGLTFGFFFGFCMFFIMKVDRRYGYGHRPDLDDRGLRRCTSCAWEPRRCRLGFS
jgi:hypothetical protein